ncbi:demethoxyubiquinone hydroxylase family protein [Aminobacter aganoensis]|uniref:Ubiquinone biosynthesis monooxygenase Coq7 n=1 Tax=Aminobacter aganoensis TaxID=83264 RepID=A0A7X0FBT3_9HYPH|nr:demethoxyubiquinone hydroxylase family protein [Aminobacter aganoensis]MBB6356750.1 ubiquinone biosynthesis monooxygenase Coq7 [Aminobacter aganoensis]
MLLPAGTDKITIQRILKVNHAGERAAINIYGAQIAIARRFFPTISPELERMRADEIVHATIFRDAMPARDTRPCRVMKFWSLGGYVLGLITSALGPQMVWLCTEAVEATVHRHLEEQLRFLKGRDEGLHAAILGIQEEELAHLEVARARRSSKGLLYGLAYGVIAAATSSMIWLSTWGDTSWMKRELEGSR